MFPAGGCSISSSLLSNSSIIFQLLKLDSPKRSFSYSFMRNLGFSQTLLLLVLQQLDRQGDFRTVEGASRAHGNQDPIVHIVILVPFLHEPLFEYLLQKRVVGFFVEFQVPHIVQVLLDRGHRTVNSLGIDLHSWSTVSELFFSRILWYFSSFLLALIPCQGSCPFRK